MGARAKKIGRMRVTVLRVARALCVLAVPINIGASAVNAQETKPAGPRDAAPSGTVLNAEFARKLADPNLDWPSAEGIAAAEARDTEYARYDAARWQSIALNKAYAAIPYGARPVREEGAELTAGVGAGGYDSIFHRWEAGGYRLQFCCTRGMMFVMAEPTAPAQRNKLSDRDVERRTAVAVSELVCFGSKLLASSSMKLEPTEYGYQISFQQTPEQAERLRRDESAHTEAVSNEWLPLLKIRTDGYSFVFAFVKAGVGPAAPSFEKTWFKERKPPKPPSQ